MDPFDLLDHLSICLCMHAYIQPTTHPPTILISISSPFPPISHPSTPVHNPPNPQTPPCDPPPAADPPAAPDPHTPPARLPPGNSPSRYDKGSRADGGSTTRRARPRRSEYRGVSPPLPLALLGEVTRAAMVRAMRAVSRSR